MLRHPDNPNLTLTNGPYWKGLPIPVASGPYVCEYLEAVRKVLADTGARYPRHCVVRFDLHFPQHWHWPDSGAISRFFHRLLREIASDLSKRARNYPCQVAYVWAAERHVAVCQHYHVALFLNKDAYYGLGRYPSMAPGWYPPVEAGPGLAHCIVRAWAHALRLHIRDVLGCVYFATKGVYHLDRNSQRWGDQFLAAFERVRYLAKARTKEYGTNYRCFGSSRTPPRSEEGIRALLPPRFMEDEGSTQL